MRLNVAAYAQAALLALTVTTAQAQTAAEPAPETTELPELVVEAKGTKKSAKKKSVSATPQAAPAPQPLEPREQTPAETATSPVVGFVATQSATGTKSDTPIVETPRSISVVTKDDINARGGALNLNDVLTYTAGAFVTDSVDTRSNYNVNIRGFSTWEALYLDGLALPTGLDRAQPQIEPYGLERVEVLKGPASILYGQSAPGGIINMVSKRPTLVPLNEVQIQIGSFDRVQTAFDFSNKIDAAGKFSYRLTGLYQESEAQVDFVNDDRIFIAPAFTWRPDADTALTLLTHYRRNEGKDFNNYLPLEGTKYPSPYGKIPRERYTGEPDFDRNDTEQYGLGYAFDKRFNEVLSFSSNFRYFHNDIDYRALLFPEPIAGTPLVDRTFYNLQETQEAYTADNRVHVRFDTGPLSHKITAGIDYRHQTNANGSGYYSPWDGFSAPLDIFNPVYGLTPIPNLPNNYTADRTLEQVGYYIQDQIAVGGWRLSLGARHDDAETREIFDGPYGLSDNATDSSAETYNVGLLYLFENGFAPYASYAESFVPLIGAGLNGVFEPKTGNQYEIGFKYQPPGSASFLSMALFDLTEQNRVTSTDIIDPSTGWFYQAQIGEVRIKGVEIEGKANIGNWDLLAAYTYLDSEITKSGDGDQGNEVDDVPNHMASLWVNYRFAAGSVAHGFNVGGGVRYVSTFWGDTGNTIGNESTTLFDLAAGYDFGAYDHALNGISLDLNVTNVADDDTLSCDVGGCIYGRGRTYIATLKYAW